MDFYGNYRLALLSPRGGELRELMRAENMWATVLIIVLMAIAQLLLVAAIVGGAWWLAERNSATTAMDDGPLLPEEGPPETDPG